MNGVGFGDGSNNRRNIRTHKGVATSHVLQKERANNEIVGLDNRFASQLFRRHVRWCAGDRSGRPVLRLVGPE